MTPKTKRTILDLDPVSKAQDDLKLYTDPFELVYNSLSQPERALVDTGRFHILAERAIEVKGVIGAHLMGEVSEEVTEVFTEALVELDRIIGRVGESKSAPYGAEFIHRRKQQLAKNLERLEGTVVNGLIMEVGRSVYPPNEKETEFERKSRLKKIWEALTR
jgi:hypothetical protein